MARRNVQQFDLSFISCLPFELSLHLVTCESLVSIKLCFDTPCVPKLPRFSAFGRLKSLDLLGVELLDYSLLQQLISNSPFLRI